jgi:flagellin-like hook-associated protein FlgL
MTISAYGSGAYRAATPNRLVSTRSELTDLERQLATQQRAESYGDLGMDRRVSLDLNNKLSTLDSWLEGITRGDVNLKIASQAVETYAKLTNETVNDTRSNTYLPSSTGRSAPQVLAEEKFKQTLDLLNSQVNGRYLFSGKTADIEPTVTYSEIIEGDGTGRAGLRQMINERRLADLGAAGLGRLTTGGAGATATIADETPAHGYGFKLAGATSSSAALTPTFTAGPPADLSVTVASQPAVGDTLRVQLSLPDGTQEEIVLTARAAGTTGPASDSFEIGADVNATAANLRASITAALGKEAATTLSAASSQVAAANFFAGSTNSPPLRVPGPPYDTATAAPAAGTAANTVIWYRGDDGSDHARSTATVQVDTAQLVGTGARANEEAFRIGLAQFAVMAVESFPATDANSQARYEAMTARVSEKLSFGGSAQKPAEIITELGTAQTSLARAKERHESSKNYLTTSLAGVENVSKEEVAVQILALQTQLQASYETTSILSKLTLTNYL